MDRNAYLHALGITQWRHRDAAPDASIKPLHSVEQDGKASNVQIKEVSKEKRLAHTKLPQARVITEQELPKHSGTATTSIQINPEELRMMDLVALRTAVKTCTACEIHQTRKQTVFGDGHHKADWFIVTESPSADEEREGKAFVGPSGMLLTQMLRAIGLAREEVFVTNIIKCRTLNNREPQTEEILNCGHYLQRQIECMEPKIILCLGRIAAQAMLNVDLPVGKIRGQVYTYDKYADIPLLVTYHPAYLLRSPKEKTKVWEDLKLARSSFLAAP